MANSVDSAENLYQAAWTADLGGNVYRICEQPYDRMLEAWEFEPGALVVAEEVAADSGTILAATRLAGPTSN